MKKVKCSSVVKAAVLTAATLSLSTSAFAEPGYAGEWKKTRLYGHSYSSGDFTDEQYDWIRDHFEYFTIEKTHLKDVYGSPSHEYSSHVTATKLIEQNPKCKPIMIYSVGAAYCDWFESEAQALIDYPEYFTYDDAGEPVNLNRELKAENDWYIDVVNRNCDESDLYGIFVDGWRGSVRKFKSNMEYITSNMTGFRLINGFILNVARDGMYDGVEYMDKADGVFIDSFFRNTCDTLTAGETMLDTCIQVPNDKMMVCFSAYDGWSKTHEFSHAAYLIVANDNTYYRWVDEGDHLWSQESLMTWHDDFGKEMGAPLGKATKNGYVYTRVFEHCTVTLDIENVTSSIEWGQNNVAEGIIEAENYTSQSGLENEGSNIGYINHNDWARYNGVNLSAGTYEFSINYSSKNQDSAVNIETVNGTVIATVDLPYTGAWDTYTTTSISIDLSVAASDIVLKFQHPTGNTSKFLCNVDWFLFEGAASDIVVFRKANATGYAIDGNWDGSNGQNVYLWTYNGNINQQWEEIDRGGGYYSYQKLGTSFSLDGGEGGADGQNLYLWTTDPDNFNQQWKKVDLGNGSYQLQKRNATGYAIDGNWDGADGQNVYIWKASTGNVNQQWKLEYQ